MDCARLENATPYNVDAADGVSRRDTQCLEGPGVDRVDRADRHAGPEVPPTPSRFAWSLSNLVALLRMNLFTHRDLWGWLDQPFEGPPAVLTTSQGVLALA
jgi:hypothetical protein